MALGSFVVILGMENVGGDDEGKTRLAAPSTSDCATAKPATTGMLLVMLARLVSEGTGAEEASCPRNRAGSTSPNSLTWASSSSNRFCKKDHVSAYLGESSVNRCSSVTTKIAPSAV